MIEAIHPLILSLRLNESAFEYFNTLRKTYFPAERNFIDAHLTLFHHLPADKQVEEALQIIAANHAIVKLQIQQIVSIGNGVAFKLESDALRSMHRTLQKKWWEHLTNQDKQGLWPHVTIQNKVPAETAKKLKEELDRNFTPFEAMGVGLDLWEYHSGPWKLINSFLFQQSIT